MSRTRRFRLRRMVTMSGHQWTRAKYDRKARRWSRRCVIGGGFCTAVEYAARGHRPKDWRR